MNTTEGLGRIAIVLKIFALLWLGLFLGSWIVLDNDPVIVIGVGIVPSVIVWTIGWIVQGFATKSG